MILITSEKHITKETDWINALFSEGLETLHVRKPNWPINWLYRFFEQIDHRYLSRISIHQHHEMAECYGLNRLHFTENARTSNAHLKGGLNSTSTHCIEDFNNLNHNFAYAFLSPVYASISKANHVVENLLNQVEQRTNFKTKLVALGGIADNNITATLSEGFDNVALLGAVWQSENPVKYFKKCQQIVRSF